MRNNEDSDTYFFVSKKTHSSQKSFPVVPDQAVAEGLNLGLCTKDKIY